MSAFYLGGYKDLLPWNSALSDCLTNGLVYAIEPGAIQMAIALFECCHGSVFSPAGIAGCPSSVANGGHIYCFAAMAADWKSFR